MKRKAFTLIEVAVTLTLLAIVGTLAVASFSHMSNATSHMSARNSVDRVVLMERTWAANNGFFSTDALVSLPGDLKTTTGASTSPGEVSVTVTSEGILKIALLDGSGNCETSTVQPPSAGGEETPKTYASDLHFVCDSASI